ncbi:uncharacterized protein LOC122134426 [Cyprinus carpio]|uniref:Uncharacterized protein LOC122134426 n=1 Tax=Cyprinus carpio TaxID=7962 RepID=A0A9R0APG5_CYPCA|nr:uncharacterized protein LOC122134426 [Cyprinus carpio]
MCLFFTFITCIIVIIAGAVSDNVIVKVRRGENLPLSIRTSELKIVSRLTVRKDGTQEIFRYCSPEEQNYGCKPINPERFSLRIGNESVSVTVLDANTSDEGVYDVEVIDDKHNRIHQKFTVALTEQLPSTINPEPPSIHPLTTPAISTKGEETLRTNGTNTKFSEELNHKIIWGIIGGIIGGLSGVIAVVSGIIYYKKASMIIGKLPNTSVFVLIL